MCKIFVYIRSLLMFILAFSIKYELEVNLCVSSNPIVIAHGVLSNISASIWFMLILEGLSV